MDHRQTDRQTEIYRDRDRQAGRQAIKTDRQKETKNERYLETDGESCFETKTERTCRERNSILIGHYGEEDGEYVCMLDGGRRGWREEGGRKTVEGAGR